jgi:hypothetical protein
MPSDDNDYVNSPRLERRAAGVMACTDQFKMADIPHTELDQLLPPSLDMGFEMVITGHFQHHIRLPSFIFTRTAEQSTVVLEDTAPFSIVSRSRLNS